MRALSVVPLIALSACTFDVKCGSTAGGLTVNEEEVEAALAQAIGPDASIECKEGVKPAPGARVPCKVVLAGQTYTIEAVLTTASASTGKFQYVIHLDGRPMVIAPRMESSLARVLEQRHGERPELACGATLQALPADGVVRCAMTVGPTQATLVAKITDDLDVDSMTFEPPLLARNTVVELVLPTLREKLGATVELSCAAPAMFPRPADGVLRCEAVDGDRRRPIAIEIDAELTVQRWELVE